MSMNSTASSPMRSSAVRWLVTLVVALWPLVAGADDPSPLTPRQVVEAMRACLPITDVDEDAYGFVRPTVDGAPETFFLAQVSGGNYEHYAHPLNPEVQLGFVRYPASSPPSVPFEEIREFRDGVVSCFNAVP